MLGEREGGGEVGPEGLPGLDIAWCMCAFWVVVEGVGAGRGQQKQGRGGADARCAFHDYFSGRFMN